MVIKDNSVDETIILDILSTILLGEYRDPTKYVSTALGIADCIKRTPAGYPDRLNNFISEKPIIGPTITLTAPSIIASYQDLTFSFVRATPNDINTRNMVA